QVAREQPEQFREYFIERLRYYRERSITLPKGNEPVIVSRRMLGES
ncbi:TPA: hypothetical protein LU092_003307, partial [Enterobacter hormaechei subsp. xiangfangensis]|nr:hypothetical protein [Enterobacter hormaechei subsp. xiangfangensis]